MTSPAEPDPPSGPSPTGHSVRSLTALLEATGEPLLLLDRQGLAICATAVWQQLAADARFGPLAARAHALALLLLRRQPTGHATSEASVAASEGRFTLRACLVPDGWGRPSVLVRCIRHDRELPPLEELVGRYRLTPQEARVALLLAHGGRNRDIAEALGVREATARRHTESVLRKLGVPGRAAVAARLAALAVPTLPAPRRPARKTVTGGPYNGSGPATSASSRPRADHPAAGPSGPVPPARRHDARGDRGGVGGVRRGLQPPAPAHDARRRGRP